jgi:tetraacyldisaccharide 4'-kinase
VNSSFANKSLSGLWSGVNGFARALKQRSKQRLGTGRVISVGNIQAGGTGKTPLVARIANDGADRGLKVAILLRGYRSSWEKQGGVIAPFEKDPAPVKVSLCGDEAALLHELAPDAWIGVGSNRVCSLKRVEKIAGSIDCIVLDDGFQQFSIQKDLEIVLMTARSRGDAVFRESDRALQNADLVIWTKGKRPLEVALKAPELQARFKLPDADKPAQRVLLVSGVGDSRFLFDSVAPFYDVLFHRTFRDHENFSLKRAEELLAEAAARRAQVALTGKDWVKWRELGVKRGDVIVLEPTIELQSMSGDSAEGKETWSRLLWGK